MALILRPFTKGEWSAVKAALPPKFHTLMDEIERVRECCWKCEHMLNGEVCTLHDIKVPHEQRNQPQECFQMMVVPF